MLSEYNLLKEVNILKFRSRTIWTKVAEQNSEKSPKKMSEEFLFKNCSPSTTFSKRWTFSNSEVEQSEQRLLNKMSEEKKNVWRISF